MASKQWFRAAFRWNVLKLKWTAVGDITTIKVPGRREAAGFSVVITDY